MKKSLNFSVLTLALTCSLLLSAATMGFYSYGESPVDPPDSVELPDSVDSADSAQMAEPKPENAASEDYFYNIETHEYYTQSGDGTHVPLPMSPDQPILIKTADGLLWFSDYVNNGGATCIEDTLAIPYQWSLEENITISKHVPIGTKGHPFKGSFSGSHTSAPVITITSLVQDSASPGLFGYIENAAITDVRVNSHPDPDNDLNGGIVYSATNSTISHSNVSGSIGGNSTNMGCIANTAVDSTIEGCAFDGSMNAAEASFVGGIVGNAINCDITDCRISGSIHGASASHIGGIVGSADNSDITDCRNNSGTLSGLDVVGGIVGRLTNGSRVSTSYNLGAIVAGKDNAGGAAGGICGQQGASTEISFCYNGGSVTSAQGGTKHPISLAVGSGMRPNFIYCFYDNVKMTGDYIKNTNSTAFTTAELKSTFASDHDHNCKIRVLKNYWNFTDKEYPQMKPGAPNPLPGKDDILLEVDPSYTYTGIPLTVGTTTYHDIQFKPADDSHTLKFYKDPAANGDAFIFTTTADGIGSASEEGSPPAYTGTYLVVDPVADPNPGPGDGIEFTIQPREIAQTDFKQADFSGSIFYESGTLSAKTFSLLPCLPFREGVEYTTSSAVTQSALSTAEVVSTIAGTGNCSGVLTVHFPIILKISSDDCFTPPISGIFRLGLPDSTDIWSVSKDSTPADDTLYSSDIPVYFESGTVYNFTKHDTKGNR